MFKTLGVQIINYYLFKRSLTKSFITLESANVVVSPNSLYSSEAIVFNILRIIFPDIFLGNPEAKWMKSGVAIGPIFLRTHFFNSSFNSFVVGSPVLRET